MLAITRHHLLQNKIHFISQFLWSQANQKKLEASFVLKHKPLNRQQSLYFNRFLLIPFQLDLFCMSVKNRLFSNRNFLSSLNAPLNLRYMSFLFPNTKPAAIDSDTRKRVRIYVSFLYVIFLWFCNFFHRFSSNFFLCLLVFGVLILSIDGSFFSFFYIDFWRSVHLVVKYSYFFDEMPFIHRLWWWILSMRVIF